MIECYKCGFWDSEREGCSCPSPDMFYACPIESEKPENKEELNKMAEWYANGGEENEHVTNN